MKKTLQTIGKIFLVILGCALAPILLWVALGVAVRYKMEKKKKTVHTLQELLQRFV